MSNEIATAPSVSEFSKFLDKFKPQMALALPAHLNVDRMARLALTQFSTNQNLQASTPQSICASLMTASTLGLEPGVNGQGYLIPYFDNRRKAYICQFVPGWKGLVDIANRSGRCSVWTGAVFEGDEFDYNLGDNPFIKHKPGDEDRPEAMTHAYAVGRVRGSDYPVIEVWTVNKVRKHRDQYNKVGEKHYSFRDWEMYARKVPLLQVLKYMPASIELNNAITAANAADVGKNTIIDGNIVTIEDDDGPGSEQVQKSNALPVMTDEVFARELPGWQKLIESGKKTADAIITNVSKAATLTADQIALIRAAATPEKD